MKLNIERFIQCPDCDAWFKTIQTKDRIEYVDCPHCGDCRFAIPKKGHQISLDENRAIAGLHDTSHFAAKLIESRSGRDRVKTFEVILADPLGVCDQFIRPIVFPNNTNHNSQHPRRVELAWLGFVKIGKVRQILPEKPERPVIRWVATNRGKKAYDALG